MSSPGQTFAGKAKSITLRVMRLQYIVKFLIQSYISSPDRSASQATRCLKCEHLSSSFELKF